MVIPEFLQAELEGLVGPLGNEALCAGCCMIERTEAMPHRKDAVAKIDDIKKRWFDMGGEKARVKTGVVDGKT